jgi:hypothetical protein
MKKVVVLTLVVALVAFVSVSFAKVAGPNTPDANKPVKDPNAPKANISINLAKVAGPNDANKPAKKDPNAPKANISMRLTKGVCPNMPDANKPAKKDPNAPKANIIINLAKVAGPNDANKPAKEPNAPKANIVLRLAVEPNAPAKKAEAITIRGRLIVIKDANGVIMSVIIESKRPEPKTINIVLDAKGKELAEKMAGKPVEVTGVESTKGGEKWLTVEKFGEVQRPTPGGPGGPKPPAPGGDKK